MCFLLGCHKQQLQQIFCDDITNSSILPSDICFHTIPTQLGIQNHIFQGFFPYSRMQLQGFIFCISQDRPTAIKSNSKNFSWLKRIFFFTHHYPVQIIRDSAPRSHSRMQVSSVLSPLFSATKQGQWWENRESQSGKFTVQTWKYEPHVHPHFIVWDQLHDHS